MPDLGEILGSAVAGLPAFFGNLFVKDPGTWAFIGLMLLGILALSLVSGRRRRRR